MGSRYWLIILLLLLILLILVINGILWSQEPIASDLTVRRFEITLGASPQAPTVNTYLIYDSNSGQGLLIDPGLAHPAVDAFLARHPIHLLAILNTHGHSDHTGGNGHYARLHQIKVYAPQADRFFYRNPHVNELPDQIWIKGPDFLQIGPFRVAIIDVPGHSMGSVCFLIGPHLFSGDTLMAGTIGRPAGLNPREQAVNRERLITNIHARLMPLPDETLVWPGHRAPSTIGRERRENRWLRHELICPKSR